MSNTKTFYKTAEVEVSLDVWSDKELIDELEERGVPLITSTNPEVASELLTEIWRLRRNGEQYDHLMDKFLYNTLGVLV